MATKEQYTPEIVKHAYKILLNSFTLPPELKPNQVRSITATLNRRDLLCKFTNPVIEPSSGLIWNFFTFDAKLFSQPCSCRYSGYFWWEESDHVPASIPTLTSRKQKRTFICQRKTNYTLRLNNPLFLLYNKLDHYRNRNSHHITIRWIDDQHD